MGSYCWRDFAVANGAEKYIVDTKVVVFIKKGEVVEQLMNGKSQKFVKTVVFSRELSRVTINLAEMEITGKPITNGKKMAPVKLNLNL